MFSYLALISGIVSEADYVFIPESPPPRDWQSKLCNKLVQARNSNKLYHKIEKISRNIHFQQSVKKDF